MSSNKLFVGNLSYSATKEQLRELFSGYGTVTDVKFFEDKGFGFVEMSSQAEAEKARVALSGYNFQGRTLNVDEARPQKSRDSRGSYQGNQRKQGYQNYRGRK
ncbi:MAG TPA: RNA-binding protein [Thermodesulfobacteriota bacterium]|nr:RNA-binding protein [Thermodesulfobacteriota bacterium]